MEGSASTGIVDALTTAFTTASSDMMSAITAILPIALGVGTAILVIFLGWKLFKRLTK